VACEVESGCAPEGIPCSIVCAPSAWWSRSVFCCWSRSR
jgi:hypothetical protein